MRNLTLIFTFLTSFIFAQKVDTIIDRGIYRSHFCYELKQPIAVTYTLYQGGGEASRYGDNFTNDIKQIKMLDGKTYHKSGYDKGHMAPAEDFAYNDSLQNLTFRYYNCVPQTPELNRGPWKKYETKARKLSQLDTLVIVCYNTYKKSTTPVPMRVPSVCYKAVFDAKTKKLLFSVGFENTPEAKEVPVNKTVLKKLTSLSR